MPRCVKSKRLTEWLDREQERLGRDAKNSQGKYYHILEIPLWVNMKLLAERKAVVGPWGAVELPSGKSCRVKRGLKMLCRVYPSRVTIDVSRFYPKNQTGVLGTLGLRTMPVPRRPVFINSEEVSDSTPDRVQTTRRRPSGGIEYLTWAEAARRFPR